jgi:uncharacterized membrane protein YphA (DoxX/SURF4 family)
MDRNAAWGLFVIRIGLSGVLLWFGTREIFTPAEWIGYVPMWAVALSGVSAASIVLLNGILEIISGLLILLGVFTRLAALAMGLHLVLIAFSLGYNSIAVRDMGLAAAFFGIALAGGGAYSLTSLRSRH